jgi:hypothetical protein
MAQGFFRCSGQNAWQRSSAPHDMSRSVPVFFYGGLINPALLDRLGIPRRERTPAMLPGYELVIRPWVNLEPVDLGVAYGVVMDMSGEELDRIYSQLAIRYAPAPVVVVHGRRVAAATCYFAAESMVRAQAEEGHVRVLLEAAEALGLPEWYLGRIRSFLPQQ